MPVFADKMHAPGWTSRAQIAGFRFPLKNMISGRCAAPESSGETSAPFPPPRIPAENRAQREENLRIGWLVFANLGDSLSK